MFEHRITHPLNGFGMICPRCSVCFNSFFPCRRLELCHGCALNPIRWRGWRVSLGCMVRSWIPTLCVDCPHFLLIYLQEVGTGSWLSFKMTSMFGRKNARQQDTRGIRMPSCFLAFSFLHLFSYSHLLFILYAASLCRAWFSKPFNFQLKSVARLYSLNNFFMF